MKQKINIIYIVYTIFTITLLAAPGRAGAQILSSLDTLRYDDSAYAADGLIGEWDSVLGEFESIGIATEKEIQKEIADAESHRGPVTDIKKVVSREGIVMNIPKIPGENGEDLFMLTDDGILIYLLLDSPAYYADGDEETVIKWIRYYCHERRQRTMTLFSRFRKWEPWMRERMRSGGVPEEIAELCMLESGCTASAKSPAGAVGMWQFMPGTGKLFGLTIAPEIGYDDRLDPVKSTYAAVKLMKANYKKTKDWTLAVAAYNCGTGRIQSAARRAGSYEWSRLCGFLPSETRNYIPGLVALRYAWKYRRELALDTESSD